VSKTGTKATITAKALTQNSAPPLTGKFDIVCVSEAGQESTAINMNSNSHEFWIGHAIQQQCVGLYNRIEAFPCDEKVPHRENGMCINIRFKGLLGNPGQFRV
jgi:hypothetical protein